MKRTLLALAAAVFATAAGARVFLSQQQALALVFPKDVTVTRQALFLTDAQRAAAQKKAGVAVDSQMIVRYVGRRGSAVVGYAYFDTHRVRTMPETLMLYVTPAGQVDRIEVLSFDEPPDYFPKQRWVDQFHGRPLDDELSLKGAIRPISGASLTGKAFVEAARRTLALHGVLGP